MNVVIDGIVPWYNFDNSISLNINDIKTAAANIITGIDDNKDSWEGGVVSLLDINSNSLYLIKLNNYFKKVKINRQIISNYKFWLHQINKIDSNTIGSEIYDVDFINDNNSYSPPSKITMFYQTRYASGKAILPLPLLAENESLLLHWIYQKFQDNNSVFTSNDYTAYIERCKAFFELECNGINYNQSIIYPQYIINKTESGRAICVYHNNSIKLNLLALPKNDDTRSLITSRFGNNGLIMSVDIEGMHPRIVAYLNNLKVPNNVNIYEYIFGTRAKTSDEYKQMKQKAFSILYGGDNVDTGNNFFFEIARKYHNRKFKTPLNREGQNFSSNSEFNMFIQKYEVDYMTVVMNNINQFLKPYQSKMVLYQYDGLVFDIHKSEIDICRTIVDMMEHGISNYVMPCNVKIGSNFKNLKVIKWGTSVRPW